MRPVWLLAAAQGLCASGTSVIVLLAGILGTQLAPRPEWATLPVSMAIVGLALSTIPAALLMRRIGRKRAFMLSAAVAACAAISIAWAVQHQRFAIFCIASAALGANLAFVQQYRFAAIEYLGLERASVAISTVMLGTLAAAVLGPQLALAARHWLSSVEYVGSFVAIALDGLSVENTAHVIQSHLLGMYLPSLASGWLTARLGVTRLMAAGLALMGACTVISLLGSAHFLHYFGALVLLGAGWNLLFVAGTTLLTRTYRPSERFQVQAVNDFSIFGAQALASLLAGPSIYWLGWTALNMITVPLLLATAAALIVLQRARNRVSETAVVSGRS